MATNPLAEGMAKVTGIDPLSTTTGTSPITYDDTGGFRAPEGDIITISGDPGTGATTAETWGHELDLAQQQFEELQFQYAQQQDILQQQQWEQQQALNEAASALAQSQYGLDVSANQRAAEMQPYSMESASIANQLAAYDLQEQQREEQFRNDYYAAAERQWADMQRQGYTIASNGVSVVPPPKQYPYTIGGGIGLNTGLA